MQQKLEVLTSGRSGRPYRVGRRRATREEFDAEVLRLFKAGRELAEIREILNRSRTTIWLSLSRSRARDPDQLQAAKVERQYQRGSADEFLREPVIAAFRDDLRARRVRIWKRYIARIREICDDLEIYPDQLDLEWGKKWLASKAEISLEQLRAPKIAARRFLKAQGFTDYELGQAGFDAKHYDVGKWKHVRMTEAQIRKVRAELRAHASRETQFAFDFGIETCRTKEQLSNLTGDQFYTLKLGTGRVLYCCNLFRKKTEKTGAHYKVAYVTRGTYELARELAKGKKGGRVMLGRLPELIYPELRAAYQKAGVTVAYFFTRPIHALRHAGAQRLLEKTGFNRAVVAELGGWDSEKTLEDHYGGVPVDLIRSIAESLGR